MPLLSFDFSTSTRRDPYNFKLDEDPDEPPKRWFHYLPLCSKYWFSITIKGFSTRYALIVLVVLMIAPHPSWLLVLVNHYLRALQSPSSFLVHLLVSYSLTFSAFCSLIVCVARDPGPVSLPKGLSEEGSEDADGDDLGLHEALMTTPDFSDDELNPLRWCRTCWGPKPERTHHCNLCGRCVLKMGMLWMFHLCYCEC